MRLVKFFLLVGIFCSSLSANSDKKDNDNSKHNKRVNTLVGARLAAAIPASQQSFSDLYYDFPGSSQLALGTSFSFGGRVNEKIDNREWLAPYHIDFP